MCLRRLQSCFLVEVDVLLGTGWFLEVVDLGKLVSFVVELVPFRDIELEEEEVVVVVESLSLVLFWDPWVDRYFEVEVFAADSSDSSLKVDLVFWWLRRRMTLTRGLLPTVSFLIC